MRTPRVRFRDRVPKQVSKMSPMPANPASVSGFAPMAVASQRISAVPWQISADMAFMPKPRPSHIPAAIASTFFNAPAISTPTTSSVVLTRKYGDINSLCTTEAAAGSAEAATTAVGRWSMISFAKEGPETTTTGFSSRLLPRACGMRSHMNSREPSSRPFERATTGMPLGTYCATASNAFLEDWTGTATMRALQSASSAAACVEARKFRGKSNSDKYLGLMCFVLM
mmetsp:Transcript_173169/g.555338  ORF Transcript_173169/g.555338 Transcript_173169/m.555338 type:complete len:227 (+) Transcript_173169:324-1004(+)